MKVVILCGGKGTRMEKETEYVPKPMLTIGEKPILWHIMTLYSSYGFREFILCLGYKGDVIKNYFLNFSVLNSDFTVNLTNSNFKIHNSSVPDWNITMVDTGLEAKTGARIKRIEKYVNGTDFMMTYGDAVANIDIKKLLEFHVNHKKTATMTGVFPLYKSRFGELSEDNDSVVKFVEKPVNCAALTNGGFFVLGKGVFKYLRDDDGCVFERDVLEKLAGARELSVYKHDDFWCCMDTPRDRKFLNDLWYNNSIPWIKENRAGKKNWKQIFDKTY